MSDKRKYEAVIVLSVQGKEESIDDTINSIAKEIEEEGAKLDSIDKLGKKDFAYNARHQRAGYYVNYVFFADPSVIDSLRSRLDLHGEIYMQHYQVLAAH